MADIELKQVPVPGSDTSHVVRWRWRWQQLNGWTKCNHFHETPEGAVACRGRYLSKRQLSSM